MKLVPTYTCCKGSRLLTDPAPCPLPGSRRVHKASPSHSLPANTRDSSGNPLFMSLRSKPLGRQSRRQVSFAPAAGGSACKPASPLSIHTWAPNDPSTFHCSAEFSYSYLLDRQASKPETID